MRVRAAQPGDRPGIMNVLDGADLAIGPETVERRIETGHVLVTVAESGIVLGTIVAVPRPEGAHVEALAVRPGRRGQGIGSRLVEAAADRWDRLTAAFDRQVSDFYQATGFEIWPTGERCFGERV